MYRVLSGLFPAHPPRNVQCCMLKYRTVFRRTQMAQSILDAYMPVAIFLAFAVIFPVLTYFITRLVRPNKPTYLKGTTYECGEIPEGEAQIQFSFQYYMFALIFVVFDVAAVFLLLMALMFTGMGDAAKVAVILFAAVLFVTTNYALKKEEVLTI